jgi:alanine dehydrogenase
MRIGVPRECKDGERRVGLLPEGAAQLCAAGHEVLVETGAGGRTGFADDDYRAAGACIVGAAADIFASTLVVKVKELQAAEFPLLHAATTIFGFAHLASDPALLAAVLRARIRCIAFETVTDADDGLPLLAPMSEIAGRLAPLLAASLLLSDRGGSGVLLPGIQGVAPANVTIVGAGHAGAAAASVAAGLGARVTVFARTDRRLAALRRSHVPTLTTRCYDAEGLAASVADADVVIGAVLVRGKLSPKLITRPMLRSMRCGSVFVDIGIDQGGIAETSRPTSLSDPTYVEEDVIHYCVSNLPALVPRTATLALARATLPYVLAIANRGVEGALAADAGLRCGLQTSDGRVLHPTLGATTQTCNQCSAP